MFIQDLSDRMAFLNVSAPKTNAAGSERCFIDIGNSRERNSETNFDALTCIRPTHPIFDVVQDRRIDTEELVEFMGIWKECSLLAYLDQIWNPVRRESMGEGGSGAWVWR